MNKTKKYNYFRKIIDNEYSKDKTRKIQSGGGPPPPRRPPPLPPRPIPSAKITTAEKTSVSGMVDPNVNVLAQPPKKKFWPFTRKNPVKCDHECDQ